MSRHRSTHSLQMNTPSGPAISRWTSASSRLQKEQRRAEGAPASRVIDWCGSGLYGVPDREQHVVDDAVGLGRLPVHVEIALGIALDDLARLAGVVHEYRIQFLFVAQDLFGLGFDIACLALESAQRLGERGGSRAA